MRLSVVTGVYNRPEILDLTLRSILRTEADPKDFEIVVVNDGGDPMEMDYLICDIFHFYRHKDLNIRQIDVPENTASPARSRNIGHKASKGEVVAFIDCDMLHFCDPIKLTLDHFDRSGYQNSVLVSGEWYLVRKDFNGKKGWWLDVPPSVKNAKQTIPWAAWLALHRHHYEEIGGCDERYGYRGEDQKLNTCLHRKGLHFYKEPQMIAVHQHYKEKGYAMPDEKQMDWQMKDHKHFTGWVVNQGKTWGEI